MNKRLEMLERVTAAGGADDFAWYGLALEYRKLGRLDDALGAFAKLRAQSPEYLPMYLMAGQTANETGRAEQAREWLEAGLALARRRGDGKTAGELESELAAC